MLEILIVDDYVDAARTLSMLLRVGGHRVPIEHDASSALARRVRAMPEMDGGLIAVTGYGQRQDREQSRTADFDHHLVKPANVEQLTRIFGQVGKPSRSSR